MTRSLIWGSLLIIGILINSSNSSLSEMLNPMSLLETFNTLTYSIETIMALASGGSDIAEDTLNEVKGISSKMDQLREFFNQKTDLLAMTINQANIDSTEFMNALTTFSNNHLAIDNEYRKYSHFLDSTIDRSTITAYLEENKNQIEKLEDSVYKLYNIFDSGRADNKQLMSIINYLNSNDRIRCNKKESSQQWLSNHFNNIFLSEMRALTVMIFQYSMKMKHGDSTKAQFYNDTLRHSKNDFGKRMNHYLNAFPAALNSVSRQIRRCDFKTPIRGENFFEFEKLYQAYLMNPDQVASPCPQCGTFNQFNGHNLQFNLPHNGHNNNNYPFNQVCNGIINNCKSIPTGSRWSTTVEACKLSEDSRKRFHWISDGVASYGKNVLDQVNGERCPNGSIVNDGSHQQIVKFFMTTGEVHMCRNCLCSCAETDDATSRAIRAISLRRQRANREDNRVVIGVRLVEKDHMVHIQIKEGKLVEEGNILAGTERWVPLEDFEYEVRSVTNGDKMEKMVENRDYLYIDKYEDTLILDDFIARKNEVIVGVRFAGYDSYIDYDWKAVGLEIFTVPFDWASGKLDSIRGVWLKTGTVKSMDLKDVNVFGNPEYNLDDPLKPLFNLPIVENGIVKVTMSDMIKDAGQSVYPYFDSQEVEGNFALNGIGLFKRGTRGYGGFVAPRIHTVNITSDYVRFSVNNIFQKKTY